MRPTSIPSCWRRATALGHALAVIVILELAKIAAVAAEPLPMSPAAAAAANAAAMAYYDPVAAARTNYEAGRMAEAFDAFMVVPGVEHGALAVARTEARTYLARLETLAGKAAPATLKLLEGDLRLLLNEPAPALAAWRAAAQLLAATTNGPAYFVEPPGDTEFGSRTQPHYTAYPFAVGDGGATDNWLLRRFLKHGTPEDVAAEYARMWRVVRGELGPKVWLKENEPAAVWQTQSFSHRSFKAGLGTAQLGFALEYAGVLRRGGSTNEALAVLLEALRHLDLDRAPGSIVRVEHLDGTLWKEFDQDSVQFGGDGRGHRWHMISGVTRRHFLGAAFDTLRALGREAEAVAALEKEVAGGNNRLRRVLAFLKRLQGRPEEALALEFDYLKHGTFSPLTLAWRRGELFEQATRYKEAAAEFESILKLPPGPFAKPAREEMIGRLGSGGMLNMDYPTSASRGGRPGDGSPVRWKENLQAQYRSYQLEPGELEWWKHDKLTEETQERLIKLYATFLDDPAAARRHARERLARWIRNADRADAYDPQPQVIEQTVTLFRRHGQEVELQAWIREQLTTLKNPWMRAHLFVALGSHAEAVDAVLGVARELPPQWRQRLKTAAGEGWPQLEARVGSFTNSHPRERLVVLTSQKKLGTPEAIPALEELVKLPNDRQRPNGLREDVHAMSQLPIPNILAAAQRLARLYVQTGQRDKLHALGLRVIRAENPFNIFDSQNFHRYQEAGLPERMNAFLGLVLENARDERERKELAAALEPTVWTGAKAQVARLLGGGWPREPEAEPRAFGWGNLPDGVELFASNEHVHCLAQHGTNLFAGQPWGLAVYDLAGNPVTRVALGGGPRSLAFTADAAWVVAWSDMVQGRTRIPAVLRVSTRDWSVATLPVAADELASDGRVLWLAGAKGVFEYDPATGKAREFPEAISGDRSDTWQQLVWDGEFLWAHRDSEQPALFRIHPPTAETRAVTVSATYITLLAVGREEIWLGGRMAGGVDGSLWRVDSRTLAATRATIDPAASGSDSNYEIFPAALVNGRLFFRQGNQRLVLDREGYVLRTAPAPVAVDVRSRVSAIFPRSQIPANNMDCVIDLERLAQAGANGIDSYVWKEPDTLALPGGALVRTRHVSEDWGSYKIENGKLTTGFFQPGAVPGGLFLTPPGGAERRISSTRPADSLAADHVGDVIFPPDGGPAWVATGAGLRELAGGRLTRAIGWDAGLTQREFVHGAWHGGQLWLASRWGRGSGGLYRYDPRTTLFTSFHFEDGLDANTVARIESAGDLLKLTFAADESRARKYPSEIMHCPPGTFDPATGRFTSGGPAVASQFNDLDRERRGEAGETMPLLGGHLLQRRIADGRTWLCGTHGLVVLRGTNNGPVAALPEIPFAPPPAPRAAPAAPLVSRTETPVPKVAVATPKLEPAATKVEAVIPKVQLPLPKPENTAPKPAPVASSALLRTNSPLAKMPVLAWEPNPAEEARNKVWGEEAKAMRINYGIPVTELRQWVAHTNRMVVAQALMRGVAEKERRSPAYFEVLGSLLADPEIRVRSSALFRLDQARPPEALVALRIGLRTVTNTHEHSILALLAAEKGDPLDLPSVAGLLRLGIEQHNYPVGIDSRSGIDVSRGRICSVLVASGRRDALELALQMPARVGRPWHGETNRTPAIVLRQHPEFLPLLLAASDRNAPHQFLFAHHLVWGAGREWLPQLHAAIAGSDPIQRANAIRACGRIKDPSSIPILRQLLETADAEQLVLVVWALGELRVREAVPRVLDILRARSATFGAASGDYQHAYGSLPGEGEPLRPPHFWVALSRMGPDLAPELFLELAGERDFSARFTAAEALATMPDAYRTRAVEALRGLTTGMWNGVIQRANVSLLAYDDPDARRTVQGWLGLPRTSAGLEILPQLARIPAEHRKFLEPSLQAFRADLPKFSDMVPLIDKLLSGDNTPGRPAPK